MPQIGLEKIEGPSFTAGGRKRVYLPQTDAVHEYLLNLTGQIDVTGGTGAGDPFADGAYRAFEELRELVGKQAIQAVKATTLGKIAKLMGEGAEDGFVQTIPTDDAAGVSYPIDVWLSLPQFMPWSARQHGHAFPAAAFSKKPILEVLFGDAEDLFTNDADATGIAYGGSEVAELYQRPLMGEGVPENPRAMAARFPPVLYNYHEYDVVTSETAARIKLENVEQGDEVRTVIVETFSAGVNGARFEYDSNVIEELRFELDDDDVWGLASFAAGQQQNARVYGLTALETGTLFIDAAENKEAGRGDLWQRKSRTSVPTLYMKTSKEAGECLIRVTTMTVRR